VYCGELLQNLGQHPLLPKKGGIFHKYFFSAAAAAFQQCQWQSRSISMDGKSVNALSFAKKRRNIS
jgi:hypothetical protein